MYEDFTKKNYWKTRKKISILEDILNRFYDDTRDKLKRIKNLEESLALLNKRIEEIEPTAEDVGYIIVHCHNPEGKEINSISGVGNAAIIYDEDNNILGYGASSLATHEIPISISVGSHTIRVIFNDVASSQDIIVLKDTTQTLTFTFSRTIFDLWDKIPGTYTKTVSISGSWIGITSLIEDLEYDDLGWLLRVHFQETYAGGYDEEGVFVPSSGSYNAQAQSSWIKGANSLAYQLQANYNIVIDSVPDRPPNTPAWASVVNGLNYSLAISLALNVSGFSNWYIQYSNSCTDLSMYIGNLELLNQQGSYLLKTVPTTIANLRIKSKSITVSGASPLPITVSGGGNLTLTMASVPYDADGSAI